MTNYSNPNLTQREIVETSLLAIEAMQAKVVETADAANAHTADALDYVTAQIIAQHVSILTGSNIQLEQERARLFGIIAAWDAD
jgi:hypothetical protein